jgi:hypothetical protein
MKKIILIPMLVGATFGFFESAGQDKTAKPNSQAVENRAVDPHERAERAAERAEKRYGLNPEQKNQWQAAAMQRSMENQQLREQMKMANSPEEKMTIRQQALQNRTQFENTVKELLNEEQKVKFNRDLQEREQKKKAALKSKKKPAPEENSEDEAFSDD